MEHTSEIAHLVAGVAALLVIAAITLALTKRIKLPFTVTLVVIGIILARLTEHFPHTLEPLEGLSISPDLILYVFLPTLIFEASFNMDARQLRHNLGPILTLAVPGLVLSTVLIGLIVWAVTPIPLAVTLLLGAILSATDPVAVVALFRQIGAPERLTTLVEGESLFNDATSIVVARLLIGVVLAGSFSGETLTQGLIDFVVLFVGGLLLGLLLGLVVALILGLVESDPAIEISLTTALAYCSFLLAEEVFHLSGVMATVGAGLVMGGWGRVKISPTVRIYLEHFWEQMAFIANALIFLLVGLTVNLDAQWGTLDTLLWVILAMLAARAVLIYGLMPLVGRFPGSTPISLAYQGVMYWGGLRGAIALAIALSLPEFDYASEITALVMGAVLFTLLAEGLTIEPLMRRLGLDQPPLADRLALLERDLTAKQQVIEHIPELQHSGLFSAAIARRLQQGCEKAIREVQEEITRLRGTEMGHEQEEALLYLRALSEEKLLYSEMYSKGHLSEGAFRELLLVLTLQIDTIRFQGAFERVHSHRLRRYLEQILYRLFDRIPLLLPLAERMRMARIIRNYEEVWGHYQSSRRVLEYLDEWSRLESIPAAVMEEVHSHYTHWHHLAREQLQQVSEQFPEFVSAMQRRLGQRIVLLAEARATEEQAERGMLPKGVSEQQLGTISARLSALRGESVERLRDDPKELLRKVPLFAQLPEASLDELTKHLLPHTLEENYSVLEQGETGSSLYIIARGMVRISHEEGGEKRYLGTLMAGDFFGEMALLHHESRNATVRTATPCRLYELRRSDLEALIEQHPLIGEAIVTVDRQRRQGLTTLKS